MIDVCTVQEKGDVHRFPFGTGNTWYPCHKMSRRSRSPQGSSGLYFLRTGYNIQSVIRQLSGTQGSLHCYARVRQRRKKRREKMFLRGYTSTKCCWNACFFASAVSGFNIFKIFSPFTLLSAIYPFDHLSTFRIPNLDIPVCSVYLRCIEWGTITTSGQIKSDYIIQRISALKKCLYSVYYTSSLLVSQRSGGARIASTHIQIQDTSRGNLVG